MIFTRHAFERFRQFHMLDQPSATDEDARDILERFGPMTVNTGGKTHLGDPIWKIEALGIEIVAKHEDGVVTCVTVLPSPRFRGLTPLQAEALEASVRGATDRVSAIEREQKAHAAEVTKAMAKRPVERPVGRQELDSGLKYVYKCAS